MTCPRRHNCFCPPRLARRLAVRLDDHHQRLDSLLADAVERSVDRGVELQGGILAELQARLRRRAVQQRRLQP